MNVPNFKINAVNVCLVSGIQCTFKNIGFVFAPGLMRHFMDEFGDGGERIGRHTLTQFAQRWARVFGHLQQQGDMFTANIARR